MFDSCFGALPVFSRLVFFRTATTQKELGFVIFVVYLTHLIFHVWLGFLSSFTGIGGTCLCSSTQVPFPSFLLSSSLSARSMAVTLNGETAEWSPAPARSVCTFLPWSGFEVFFAEPEAGGYRSESKMGKAVVQLWFGPVLQLELAVCSCQSCLTHAGCFFQVIQYGMKILNFIKHIKCNLNSNLGKHFLFLMLAGTTGCCQGCVFQARRCLPLPCVAVWGKGYMCRYCSLYILSSYLRLSAFET